MQDAADRSQQVEELLRLKRRELFLLKARDSLFTFMQAMMPNPERPNDPEATLYQTTPQGVLFCDIIEKVSLGAKLRSAVSVPPQHGKTIHLSTFGPAWIWGRNPKAKIVVATYNEDRAQELGDDFQAVINNPIFKHIFPEFALSPSSKGKMSMRTTQGGKLFFVGQGSGTTGKTADFFIIDDPIKDDVQVQSDDFRDKLWKWFFSVAYSRGSNKTRMIVLHTRWHEDDLIGRLCDPNHPERNKEYEGIVDDWEYLNIPGVIKDPELAAMLGLELRVQRNPRVVQQFGTQPMCALWEADKNLLHFSQWKRGEKRSFGALVMGEPTPDDGVYFLDEWIKEYDPGDLPDDLRFYGASDHAVSEKQDRDPTVLGTVGVDPAGDIWVMPDLVWRRMETDGTVEELIAMFQRYDHMLWFMENELISKSFGPFLREEMRRKRVYTTIKPVTPSKDKQTRARSIQGRMSLGTVRFPRFASWWQDARSQLLRFPYGANDDFIDFMAHIGNGLNTIVKASPSANDNRETVHSHPAHVINLETYKRASEGVRKVANDGW